MPWSKKRQNGMGTIFKKNLVKNWLRVITVSGRLDTIKIEEKTVSIAIAYALQVECDFK